MEHPSAPPQRRLWLYENEYEIILDTFIANIEQKCAPMPFVVSTFQLPENNQLQVRLQRGFVPPLNSMFQTLVEFHYEILMKNRANYDVLISAKIDNSYSPHSSVTTSLSNPVKMQAGNPLVLLTMNPQTDLYGRPNASAEVKLIITAHIKEHSADKPSKIRHLEQLGSLLHSGLFADCKVVTNDNKSYDCHKALLSLKSEVIRTAFESEQMKEAQTAQINLNCDAAILDLVLPYIYMGEQPTVTPDLAIQLYSFAHMYQIEGLKDYLAEEIFLKADELVSVANVLEFVEFADKTDLSKLKDFCLQFIHLNRYEIVNRADWKEFRTNQGHLVDKLVLIDLLDQCRLSDAQRSLLPHN